MHHPGKAGQSGCLCLCTCAKLVKKSCMLDVEKKVLFQWRYMTALVQ